MIKEAVIVGCGGGGALVIQALAHFPELEYLLLIDPDIIEEKNLQRQIIYNKHRVGMNKAEAAAMYVRRTRQAAGLTTIAVDAQPHPVQDVAFTNPKLILECTDNHAARLHLLKLSDEASDRRILVLGGNEVDTAEAYVYFPGWKNGAWDPRTYYPQILTDQRGDVTRTDGCGTGGGPQTMLANFLSAAYQLWLAKVWRWVLDEALVGRSFADQKEIINRTPKRVVQTLARLETIT